MGLSQVAFTGGRDLRNASSHSVVAERNVESEWGQSTSSISSLDCFQGSQTQVTGYEL